VTGNAVFFELKHPIFCAACGNQIGKNDTRNLWSYIGSDGARYGQLLCDRCMARAVGSKAGHAEVVERMELRRSPS
jgi:hypothetical protein